MATTALFVEILVIGALAELWIATLVLSFVSRDGLAQLTTAMGTAKDIIPLLAFVALALTYAIGWIFNFVAERLFRWFGQSVHRDQPFQDMSAPYETARIRVLHEASDALIHEIRMDRHIIRLARGSFVNFTFLAIALLFNWRRLETAPLITAVVASAAISVAALFQWMTRYRAHYKMVARAYEVIVSKQPNTPQLR